MARRQQRYLTGPKSGGSHSCTPALPAFILLSMTLKNAALLALVGTILMTVLLVWNFVSNVIYVLRGVQAPVVLFASLIYAFGCLTVMVFFVVFHRAQR
jgi:hypothetical protein